MKKYFINIIFIVSFLFLFLSYIPNIYEASLADKLPKDRVMIWGEHIYTYDYNVYLSKIRQGTEGRLSVVDKYDNTPNQKGVFLQMLYLLAGKIGGLFAFPPPLSFHALRTVLSCVWILTIIYINITYLKKPYVYLLGTITCLLASSFPIVTSMGGEFWISRYMGWWYEMDVLRRISYFPHYTLNYSMLALLSVLLAMYSKTNKKIYFIIIAIILFASFFVHPSCGIVFIISWVLFHGVRYIWSPRNHKITHFLKETFVLCLVAFIPIFYVRTATSVYPWKTLIDFDKNTRLMFSLKEYLLALGPVVLTGVLGACMVIKKKCTELLSLVTWVFTAFFCLIVFKYIPYQSELRFIQTANHIPLAILSVYFYFEILKWVKLPSGIPSKSRSAGRRGIKKAWIRYLVSGYMGLIIVLGILQTVYSIKDQTLFIRQRAMATIPLVPYPSQVMYPIVDFYNSLIWLEKNTNHNDVVLSKITAGNYIPAYSGNFVYLGHFGETPFHLQRLQIVDGFFSGLLPEKEALDFLKKENIAYIFYGPQEKENSQDDIGRYNFLKPVFQTPMVTIYKLNSKN